MNLKFIRFGEIEIDGVTYNKDVVIERGQVRRRDNEPSKSYKAKFGHTPLSIQENIPWDCQRLVIGTGALGLLPIMPEVQQQAAEKGVEVVLITTPEACRLLSEADPDKTNAILHVTC